MTTRKRRDRPLVRYYGGKWRLAPWIIDHFPAHRVYTEAFGGGASVLLRKPRSYAEVYNDLDSEIVNLFSVARDRGPELRRALALTPFSREEYDSAYEPAEDPLERARRAVIRSYMSHGSDGMTMHCGFRGNATRSSTIPAHDWRNLSRGMGATIGRLQGVIIECRDALKVLQQYDGPETLHYVDPPYISEDRNLQHQYAYEMTMEQHEQLAYVLHGLKGHVVLSGYHSALYDRLYADWKYEERHAINNSSESRVEVLWFK